MELKELINKELFLIKKNGKIIIKEESNKDYSNRLYEVIIKSIPDSVFAFSTDMEIEICKGKPKEKARNYFLNEPQETNLDDKNEHRRINRNCDAVFVEKLDENNIRVIYCELKSTDLKAGDYEHQLINTKLLFEYILKMYNTFYNLINIKSYTFIVFYLHQETVFTKKRKVRGIYFEESITSSKYSVKQVSVKMELYPNETILKYALYHHSKNNFIEYSSL